MDDSGVDRLVLDDEPSQGVRLLTLNQPTYRNAMRSDLTEAWSEKISELRSDRSVRCVVLTGSGTAFCAGADLSWLDQRQGDTPADHLRMRMLPFYSAWLSHRDLEVPVIAAVNGPAIGAGLCLAVSCDLRYASPAARFSARFAHVGTHGGMAANWLLAEAVGISRARDMLYSGRDVGPDEALSWGMVSGVADDVVGAALETAATVARAAPIAIRLTKAGLAQIAAGMEQAMQWDALAQATTLASRDIHEGIQAFRDHREPRFTDG